MILDEIVNAKKQRLSAQKKQILPASIRQMAEKRKKDTRSFFEALSKEGLSVIGEFKKASPSLGAIASGIAFDERIAEYNESADAISCLTEEDYFKGDCSCLMEIREKSQLPILRKDFMIDEYQFYEARAIGADAVLLIAAILDDVQLRDFYRLSRELSMDVLLEVHHEDEVERALKTGARIIGINNRDLKDFTIRLDTTKRLAKEIPKEKVLVSESGIQSGEDIRFVKECGIDAVLAGRALMEEKHPKELVKQWKTM